MSKRSISGDGGGAEEESSRVRRRAGRSSTREGEPDKEKVECPLSRLGEDDVVEIAVRLASPSAACALALASKYLYSVIRPVLFRADFLASYLQRAARSAPRCPPPPPGFFLSTGSKTRRHGRAGAGPEPDTMFVRGPHSFLRSHNVVDPGPFRAFLASAKRRRACVAASCCRRLLCVAMPATGTVRYWVVDPAADLWIPLPTPPPLSGTAYPENAGFHCTAAVGTFTVAYLMAQPQPQRRGEALLVVRWFTSESGRWRCSPTAARGSSLQPAAAAARVGDAFYWPLVRAGEPVCQWPLQQEALAILACNTDDDIGTPAAAAQREAAVSGCRSWMVTPPPVHGERDGLALLSEAHGSLRYIRCSSYYRLSMIDCSLDVWTAEEAAAGKEIQVVTSAAPKWQLRHGNLNEEGLGHGVDGVGAELATWVLYNNMHAHPLTTILRRIDRFRFEQQVAPYSYNIFRYAP